MIMREKLVNIRKLNTHDKPQWTALADPSIRLVEDYVKRGHCYVAEEDTHPIGVYVLSPTRPDTIELVNVAVSENLHGQDMANSL